METSSYSELLCNLEGFDSWLKSLGLTLRPNDRVHEAFKVLRRAEEASRKGRETGIYSYIKPEDWFSITEALEAHDVFTAFHDDPSRAIAAALKRALSGPIHPIDENQANRDGRNIWFELALAAEWRLRGAAVTLGEPDLSLTRDSFTFLIACKRPDREQSIRTNIHSAIKQLQRNLNNTPSCTFGVAAISLSRVFNRGDKVFSGGMNAFGRLLNDEFGKHEGYLHSVNDPRICCVMFHAATPGESEEVDLMRVSHTVAWDFDRPSIGSQTFREHAQDMRSSPKRS
jgi:hypothetical protein